MPVFLWQDLSSGDPALRDQKTHEHPDDGSKCENEPRWKTAWRRFRQLSEDAIASMVQQTGQCLAFAIAQLGISANCEFKSAFLTPHGMMLQPIFEFHMSVTVGIRTVK